MLRVLQQDRVTLVEQMLTQDRAQFSAVARFQRQDHRLVIVYRAVPLRSMKIRAESQRLEPPVGRDMNAAQRGVARRFVDLVVDRMIAPVVARQVIMYPTGEHLIVWIWYFRDNPRQHPGITTANTGRLPAYSGPKERTAVPWAALTARMAPVTMVYFCYGWVLWLFLGWIPQYFLHNYHLQLGKSALAAIVSPVVGGWMIDATGNWNLPFIASMGIMAAGIVLSFTMRPDRQLETRGPDAAKPAPTFA
jgi:hypothetical protein